MPITHNPTFPPTSSLALGNQLEPALFGSNLSSAHFAKEISSQSGVLLFKIDAARATASLLSIGLSYRNPKKTSEWGGGKGGRLGRRPSWPLGSKGIYLVAFEGGSNALAFGMQP